MKVRCVNVTYFSRGPAALVAIPAEQPTTEAYACTVNFQYVGPEAQGLDQFSLTFTNLAGPVDYFPGKEYSITIKAVA